MTQVPKIPTPIDLTVRIMEATQGGGLRSAAADMEYAIKADRAAIIAWAEAEIARSAKGLSGTEYFHGKSTTLRDLIEALKP